MKLPFEKEFKELIDWVHLKVKRLRFFVKNGTILDFERVMGIKSGKQDEMLAYNYENNLELRFYSLSNFFKKVESIEGIGIKADIVLGDFCYPKQYFYHALKIVEDPEIGIPNKEYPLIIRNSKCSVFIAPKIYEEKTELRDLVDINDPNLIEELHLMRKDLKAVPEGIEQLKNLKKLSLGFNPLYHLQDSLKELTTLEELNLQCSTLIKLPEWIEELRNLKILNLKSTAINILPESFKNLSSLEVLNLEGVKLMNINEIPELINVNSLRELNLCKTGFSNISSLKRFKNLEVLGIAGNKIKNIKDLKYLKYLKKLNISGNKYSKIEGLEDLIKLEYLDMDLYEIEGLQNLINLKDLIINYSDKDKPLLDKLGGIWDEEYFYRVITPQKIVEYCRKKQFDIKEFENELELGVLSEISVIVLEERVNKGDEIAKKLLFLNEMKQK